MPRRCSIRIVSAMYAGDVDPKQEREAMAMLRAEAKGKRTVRLEHLPSPDIDCRIKGRFRIRRLFADDLGQSLNKIELAFKEREPAVRN